ncbi:YerC/YecD family TrpR-related protein [bacterium]|nr:YerC/YecD family TrpR-related protein [bacterium]
MEEDLWNQQDNRDLLTVLLSLENEEEAESFLRDLMTENEIRELALRWKVARMLDALIPYTQIEKETGLSSTTIARISKWLSTGAGGYKQMLKKSKEL